MKATKSEIIEFVQAIVGFIFIICFIALFVFSIRACSNQYESYKKNLPSYYAYGGNAFHRDFFLFETYTVENNHYVFYDKDGKIVGDFFVSGNNQISIHRKEN